MYYALFGKDKGPMEIWYEPRKIMPYFTRIKQFLADYKSVQLISRIHKTIFRPLKENEIPLLILRTSMKLEEAYSSAYSDKTSEAFKNKTEEIEKKVSYDNFFLSFAGTMDL